MGVLKQLLHELQQIQNVIILFIKFNVKLYVSRFGVTINGRVKLQCMYMYLLRTTLIQLLFIRSGAQSPYGMAKTSHLFSQDVTIFNWYLKSLIQLMVTLHLYLFIIKIMLSKHMFCNITLLFLQWTRWQHLQVLPLSHLHRRLDQQTSSRCLQHTLTFLQKPLFVSTTVGWSVYLWNLHRMKCHFLLAEWNTSWLLETYKGQFLPKFFHLFSTYIVVVNLHSYFVLLFKAEDKKLKAAQEISENFEVCTFWFAFLLSFMYCRLNKY